MMNSGKLILLAGVLAPAAALAQINVGDELGSSETAILAALQAQGYSASEVEMEDGEIEVEAQAGNSAFEIEVSAETGLVLAVYQENDGDLDDIEDDDDDDENDVDDENEDDDDDGDDNDDDDGDDVDDDSDDDDD